MEAPFPQQPKQRGLIGNYLAQQTVIYPAMRLPTIPPLPEQPDEQSVVLPEALEQPEASSTKTHRSKLTRAVALALALLLLIALYFTWRSPSSESSAAGGTTQPVAAMKTTDKTAKTDTPANNDSAIQVYVVGAVKHPGIYTLNSNARVYHLLKAAGGTLPEANLVALNLAAKLSDGQEVYVIRVGETPPTYVGGVPGLSAGANANSQSININTASVDELQHGLHVSSITAQNIVNYREQHGPFASVEQLSQVVSRTTYEKIKGLVTI